MEYFLVLARCYPLSKMMSNYQLYGIAYVNQDFSWPNRLMHGDAKYRGFGDMWKYLQADTYEMT